MVATLDCAKWSIVFLHSSKVAPPQKCSNIVDLTIPFIGKWSLNAARVSLLPIFTSSDCPIMVNKKAAFLSSLSLLWAKAIEVSLKLIGFEPDEVLRHGDYRKLYGLKTNEGVLERLVGLDKNSPPLKTKFKDIVRAWRRRWLVNRVKREDVLQGLSGLGAGSISKSLHIDKEEHLL